MSMEAKAVAGSGMSEAILRAVVTSARRFGRDPWEDVIREVLHLLGEAADVSRSYVYENSVAPDGALLMSLRYEWIRSGITPTVYDSTYQHYPYRPALMRWERLLGGGTTVFGLVRDFPPSEQEDMRDEGVLSAAIMPIFAGASWWGFIGFDDCVQEREWAQVELSALEVAAETLGSAITRSALTERLAEAETQLQSRAEGT